MTADFSEDFLAQLNALNNDFVASNKLINLRGRADAVLNELREKITDFRVPESQTIRHPVLLAYLAQDAIQSHRHEDAAKLARLALVMQPNHLFLQNLLRQAMDVQDKRDLKQRFCAVPFENLETEPSGEVFFCCPAWLPVPIGDLKDGDAETIWNSAAAQEIRSSVLDGSYRYCSRIHCPKLSGDTLPKIDTLTNQRQRDIYQTKRTRLKSTPKKVILSHDRSCNLSCPSCRTELILARKPEQKIMNEMVDNVIFPLLKDADRVRITASGDPFGSAHFQHVLRNLSKAGNPKLRLDLQTNGVLLTPKLWDNLLLEGRVDKLMVSIDATRKETYDIVRRDGDFEALLENLSFMSILRRTGRIRHFRLDFVVQSLNYLEMPDFVRMARRLGCDGVKFQMIRSWGTYSPAEFSKIDISEPSHPEYADFIEILRAPELSTLYVELWGMEESVSAAGKDP